MTMAGKLKTFRSFSWLCVPEWFIKRSENSIFKFVVKLRITKQLTAVKHFTAPYIVLTVSLIFGGRRSSAGSRLFPLILGACLLSAAL